MNAFLVTPSETRTIPITMDVYNDFDIPVTFEREICLGRRDERQPDESEYVAFWGLSKDGDPKAAFEEAFGGFKDEGQRLAAAIFDGVAMEPELPTSVVNLDGVSVVRIDLEKQLPGHVVYVPERLIP